MADGDEAYKVTADAGTLEILASSMSRTKQFLCRKASLLGLTDISRPKPYLADSTRRSVIEWHKNNPHPRGATGIKHTDAAKAIIAEKAVAAWARKTPDQQSEIILRGMKTNVERFGSVAPNVSRGHWKAGWREIGGTRKVGAHSNFLTRNYYLRKFHLCCSGSSHLY